VKLRPERAFDRRHLPVDRDAELREHFEVAVLEGVDPWMPAGPSLQGSVTLSEQTLDLGAEEAQHRGDPAVHQP
jgi:hypothetical protein